MGVFELLLPWLRHLDRQLLHDLICKVLSDCPRVLESDEADNI